MNNSFRIGLVFFLLAGVIGCGGRSAEEHFRLAEEARKAENFHEALDHYRALLEQYPTSPLAETSQFSIASILQNDAHDFPAAIVEYEKYMQLYPNAKNAPSALFLIGYLYHNELGNLDSAAVAYRSFLIKYPDHEMAISAQYELDHLGKSPEELLPGTSSASQSPPPSSPPGTSVTQSHSR